MISIYTCIYIYTDTYITIFAHVYIYIYIYVYLCMCVCECIHIYIYSIYVWMWLQVYRLHTPTYWHLTSCNLVHACELFLPTTAGGGQLAGAAFTVLIQATFLARMNLINSKPLFWLEDFDICWPSKTGCLIKNSGGFCIFLPHRFSRSLDSLGPGPHAPVAGQAGDGLSFQDSTCPSLIYWLVSG